MNNVTQHAENLSGAELTFQNYYVAYFDVLGYKEYYKKDQTQILDFTQKLHLATNDTKNSLKVFTESLLLRLLGNLKIDHAMFSDNVVVYMKATYSPFERNCQMLWIEV